MATFAPYYILINPSIFTYTVAGFILSNSNTRIIWTTIACCVQWNLCNTDTLGPINCVLIREVSSLQGTNNACFHEVWTWSISVLIREVSIIQGSSLRVVPLYYVIGITHILLARCFRLSYKSSTSPVTVTNQIVVLQDTGYM